MRGEKRTSMQELGSKTLVLKGMSECTRRVCQLICDLIEVKLRLHWKASMSLDMNGSIDQYRLLTKREGHHAMSCYAPRATLSLGMSVWRRHKGGYCSAPSKLRLDNPIVAPNLYESCIASNDGRTMVINLTISRTSRHATHT